MAGILTIASSGWWFASRSWQQFRDICAYAVMSNHYHLVLHVNQDQLGQWSDEEVIKRWTAIFPNNAKLVETLHLNRKSKQLRNNFGPDWMSGVHAWAISAGS